MKKNIIMIYSFMLLVMMILSAAQDKPVDNKCQCRGFKLYGKVKIVNDFPDLKVKIVDDYPDLKV